MTKNKRANGDGSIYYEKSRDRWVCSFVDPSGKRIVKRFKTQQEAKDSLTVSKSSVLTNIYITPSQLTFGQWLIDYIKLYITNSATHSTIRQYTNFATYAESLSNVPLQKLNTNLLQKLINDLPDRLCDNTKNNIANFFKRALNKAYLTKLIPYNPMDGTKIPKKTNNDVETFTLDEMNIILKYLASKPWKHRDYVIIKTAFATGMRIGEILALQSYDIFPTYINVSKSVKKDLSGKIVIGTTKNKKTRQVTAPPNIIAMLQGMKQNDNGFLFYSRTNKFLINEATMGENWKLILKTANVEYRKFHAIRHTHATQLLENGVSITEVSKRLGHSNVTVTMNTYSHLLKEQDRQNFVTDKVTEIFKF